MTTLILHEHDDRLVVELARPEARNAINSDMVAELHAACDSLERTPRILIITGTTTPERGTFAAGADIRSLRDRGRDDALAGINSGILRRIAALPMPVIAAVDGFALGGGAELAYAADLRIASTRAVFGNPETGLGIVAAAGGTWRLIELVGESLAKDLLFTVRRVNADEALAFGLVSAVHPFEDLLNAAHRLADRIAEQDPLALRLTKRLLAAPRSAHPLVDELAQAILFESGAKAERMDAFLNRSRSS